MDSRQSTQINSQYDANDLSPIQPNYSELNLAIHALRAAREAKPHVYTITGFDKPQLNICLLGCQGSMNEGPINVAKYINKIASETPGLKPDVFIILGDNFYPDGVPTPFDPRFESQFHQIYGNDEFSEIKSTPCIVVLGNHDAGRDTESEMKSYVPLSHTLLGTNVVRFDEAELQQIAHSYMAHPSDPDRNIEKNIFFQQNNLPYQSLPKHLMPHSFHSWIFGQVQIFILNSNAYLKDYLQMLKFKVFNIPYKIETNQAAWVLNEYLEARKQNRKVVFAMHHPLFTAGKRYYPSGWDAKHYLSSEEITQLSHILKLDHGDPHFIEKCFNIFVNETNEAPIYNANYNEMFTSIIYDFQGMSPDLISTAHDHSLYYYNNKSDLGAKRKICQLVSGAGGSDELQARYYFGEHHHLGAFMRSHGFSIVTYDKNKPEFDINIFYLDGKHLKFTSESATPIRNIHNDVRVEDLRTAVLTACEQYQSFLHFKQDFSKGKFFNIIPSIASPSRFFNYNTTHTITDVDCMHHIINFLNHPNPAAFKDSIEFIHGQMESIANKVSDHSFYIAVNKCLLQRFGKTIEMLHEEMKQTYTITE